MDNRRGIWSNLGVFPRARRKLMDAAAHHTRQAVGAQQSLQRVFGDATRG
jgi:hypothetical protein